MKFLLPVLALFLFVSCGKDVEGLTPEEYISQNNLQATALENGVFIVIKEEGGDVKPNFEDVVQVSFVGKLTDGTTFDNNDDFKQALNSLISGWYIGLKEIGIGGSCTLIIPHEMGFGDLDIDGVPAKSTLVFDIELKNIFKSRTIDEYIADNELNTAELEDGVHIVIHEQGNDKRASDVSKVTINYTGMLTNELIFDQGSNVSFNLKNLIKGWQIGLKEIGEGGSCTLIIPSEAAYGTTGSGPIPPNAPLVFDIDLLKVD